MRLNFNKNSLLHRKYSLPLYLTAPRLVLIVVKPGGYSVTMDLDLLFGRDALVDEELEDVASVVSLQLDDGSPLGVCRRRPVAAPRLFKVAR